MSIIWETILKDIPVVVALIVAFIIFLVKENSKNQKIIEKLEALDKLICDKDEGFRGEISNRHKYFGSKVSGKYKNLGEKIGAEHTEINKDTKNIYNMMATEKQNREILYKNNIHGKEILEKLDFIRETVNQNAQLTHEVYELKTENQNLLKENNSTVAIEELSTVLKTFEKTLSEFESFGETEEIRAYLKKIQKELSQYVD